MIVQHELNNKFNYKTSIYNQYTNTHTIHSHTHHTHLFKSNRLNKKIDDKLTF